MYFIYLICICFQKHIFSLLLLGQNDEIQKQIISFENCYVSFSYNVICLAIFLQALKGIKLVLCIREFGSKNPTNYRMK